jgi:hypothetical protein
MFKIKCGTSNISPVNVQYDIDKVMIRCVNIALSSAHYESYT